MAQIKQFTFNLFQEHAMLAWTEGPACVVIDPGFYTEQEKEEFFDYIENEALEPQAVLITHAHFDHIFGVAEVSRRFGIPVYMDPKETMCFEANREMIKSLGLENPDLSFSWNDIHEGMKIEHAGFCFEVISTPGHAPGAVCYLDRQQKLMFTGDTLFAGTIGRTDLMFSNYDDEIRSIMEKLILLEPDIRFYPGHGPSSTIGHERTANPFLEPFNEPEEIFNEDIEPVVISGLQE